MRLTSVVIHRDGSVELEHSPETALGLAKDDKIRWINVENASHDELVALFDLLGEEGEIIANQITAEDCMDWSEQERFYIAVLAAPVDWMVNETWFHLVIIPRAIVCVHAQQNPELQDFIQRRWLDRPGPDGTMAGVLFHVFQSHAEEDGLGFIRIRHQVEEYAQKMLNDDESVSVDHLEELMTRCHHLSSAHLEWQLFLRTIEFTKSRVIDISDHLTVFQHGAATLGSAIQRIQHLQKRQGELMQQHALDQQEETDTRIRILTIISAVFLPLTLIAGIYGMNFDNMPELHISYAYYLVLLGMALLALGMFGYFIWKGWIK